MPHRLSRPPLRLRGEVAPSEAEAGDGLPASVALRSRFERSFLETIHRIISPAYPANTHLLTRVLYLLGNVGVDALEGLVYRHFAG